jgi:hypothetical protein
MDLPQLKRSRPAMHVMKKNTKENIQKTPVYLLDKYPVKPRVLYAHQPVIIDAYKYQCKNAENK